MSFKALLRRFRKSEDGATAIEYGLIAAIIAIGVIAAAGGLGDTLTNSFNAINTALANS